MRGGKRLPWEEVAALVADATKLIEAEGSLVRLQVAPGGHINVVGDVHGQYFDLFTIWEQNGYPSEANPYIFNGDFVDRGSYSVEVLMALLAWKVAFPSHMRLARGNHEAHRLNLHYGFAGEALTKYGIQAYNAFRYLFDRLPLAHIVNDHVLVVHGGLPRDQEATLKDIEALDRVAESGSSPSHPEGKAALLFTDLLWADPFDGAGRGYSVRGGGLQNFGPDTTARFLKANGLGLLIRSHECKEEGFEWAHNKQCLTVFSAPNYCDACGNKGAVVRLEVPAAGGPPVPELRTFVAAARPAFYLRANKYVPGYGSGLSEDAEDQLYRLMEEG